MPKTWGLAPMLVSCLIAVFSLSTAGCQTDQPPVAQMNQNFVHPDEPFPVRRVNLLRVSPELRPARVPNNTGLAIGTIMVDTNAKHLYFIESGDSAMRYGIAVGSTGHSWKGSATIGRKSTWPAWYPTDDMKQLARGLPSRIPPGPDNPLGARALYLYQNGRDTLYRIHGTSEPWTIGTEASSGCIRMFNEDIIALYDKISVGAHVIVK